MKPGDVTSMGDGTLNAIAELNSASTFTFATPYDGTSGTELAYVVIHMPSGWGDRVELAEQTAEEIRLLGKSVLARANYALRSEL